MVETLIVGFAIGVTIGAGGYDLLAGRDLVQRAFGIVKLGVAAVFVWTAMAADIVGFWSMGGS